MPYGKYQPVTVATWVAGPGNGKWTYETYAELDDDTLYEIARGNLITKPMPEITHQEVRGEVLVCLHHYIVEQARGKVFAGPVDVSLKEDYLFQPDVLVLFNEHLDRIQEKRIIGAPDLVVEVTSPLTWLHDRIVKHMTYAAAGVPEYWFIDPAKKTVEVFVLEDSKYTSLGIFQDEQLFPSKVVPEIKIPVARFFA